MSRILNHIIQPSTKYVNSSLFVFKTNIIPAWEHESNKNAGRWILTLNNNHNLDNIWNNMVGMLYKTGFIVDVEEKICH